MKTDRDIAWIDAFVSTLSVSSNAIHHTEATFVSSIENKLGGIPLSTWTGK